MNRLLQAYGGTALGHIDAGFPPEMLREMFVSGCDAVLRALAERAENEFPSALPAIKQLVIETAEVDHSDLPPEQIHRLPGSDTPAPRRPSWWETLRNG